MKSAVILAGGQSQRMGINKCTLLFFEEPLIYWPFNVLRNIADEVIVSVSTEEDIIGLEDLLGDITLVQDEKPKSGPISGILTSFNEVKGEYVAISPCDTPFIKGELFERLFERAEGYDGAVPEINGYWEPLHAVYRRKSMIKAINKVLADGKKSPQGTYKHLDIQKLREEEIKEFDSELLSFFNINSKQDLEKASEIFKRNFHD